MTATDQQVLLAELLAERFPPMHVLERELTSLVPPAGEQYPRAMGAVRRSQARLERLEQRLRQEQERRWDQGSAQRTA